ncbi:hypothetical protein [Niallia sp. Krafla_26]|uniref:hypothetical protein n=1 Tax=Niallia sp. Krafla_26 TaxID=3064703 RepID=UPI003D16A09B
MDKAVIVGTYEFIGYHLCEVLLQEGIEVYGVHIPINTSEAMVDDKRLFIGRNSNFIEKDETFLEHLPKDMFLFIDFYSFYVNSREKILLEKIKPYFEKNHHYRSAVIMPIQKFDLENDNDDEKREKQKGIYHFYLPAYEEMIRSGDRECIENVIEAIVQIIEEKRKNRKG